MMINGPFSPARLREAMSGMSNSDLATRLGCSRSNISMYLNGSRSPNKMTVQLMAICLGVSPAWLMGLNVPKYVEKPAIQIDDELWQKISNDPNKLMLARWISDMDIEQLERVIKLLDAALLQPPE